MKSKHSPQERIRIHREQWKARYYAERVEIKVWESAAKERESARAQKHQREIAKRAELHKAIKNIRWVA